MNQIKGEVTPMFFEFLYCILNFIIVPPFNILGCVCCCQILCTNETLFVSIVDHINITTLPQDQQPIKLAKIEGN